MVYVPEPLIGPFKATATLAVSAPDVNVKEFDIVDAIDKVPPKLLFRIRFGIVLAV